MQSQSAQFVPTHTSPLAKSFPTRQVLTGLRMKTWKRAVEWTASGVGGLCAGELSSVGVVWLCAGVVAKGVSAVSVGAELTGGEVTGPAVWLDTGIFAGPVHAASQVVSRSIGMNLRCTEYTFFCGQFLVKAVANPSTNAAMFDSIIALYLPDRTSIL